MRTLSIAVVLTTVAALTGLLPATAANASPPSVLTYGGGFAVGSTDNLSAPLAPFTRATFTTGAGGAGIGTTCTVASIGGQVTANPAPPGIATAFITTQSFTSCTSTIPGVTGTVTVTVNNPAPGFKASFNDASGFPVTIAPTAAPIQIQMLETFAGAPTMCLWQLNPATYNGNYINTNSKLQLLNQQDHLLAGPPAGCGTTAQFINVTYAPFTDTSVPPANQVFVN